MRAKEPALAPTAKNDIVGVAIAVVAIAMLVSLIAPTSAVITHGMARFLTLLFGVGAFLVPLAIFVYALTYFVESESGLGKRTALGLLLIVIAVLTMLSLNTPGANVKPTIMITEETAVSAGGYVGGFIAYGLLQFLGQIVGNIVLVGVIITGIVVCGFSISDVVGRVQARLADMRESHQMRRQALAAEQALAQEGDFDDDYEDDLDVGVPVSAQALDASADTSFIGSRKTTVLTRKAKKNKVAAGQASLQDSLKTIILPKKKSSQVDDIDDDDMTSDDMVGKKDREAEKDAEAASSAKTKRLTRKRPQAGEKDGTVEGSSAGASSAEKTAVLGGSAASGTSQGADAMGAVPDFLRNPKVAAGAAAGAVGAAAGAATASSRGSSRPQKTQKLSGAAQRARKGVQAAAAQTATSSVSHAIKPARAGASRPGDADDSYDLPPFDMLGSNPNSAGSASSQSELRETQEALQNTLAEFGLRSKVVDFVSGPMVTTFRIEMGEGERVNKIKNLEDDIALTLAAEKVRIFAPIKGTSYVGIEIPNKTRQSVYLGDVLPYAKGGPLEVAIGRDSGGKPVVADLAKMPHMLVAGTTGSGKSVMINSMIMSILMRTTPKQVRLILVDPKRVEFSCYNGLPHLYVPVVTEPRQAASALQWAVSEMERRLKVFERAGARNIKVYNKMCTSGDLAQMDNPPEPMPYLVIILDELSDLMMVAGKDVEASIVRIAQLARAAGIHLIIATQRPSANVVTGLIKSNIDTRAALKVSSGLDSRVILDETGAERLLGNGDMLFKNHGLTPQRVLGCFTTDAEINEVVDYIRSQAEPDYHEEILTAVTPNTPGSVGADLDDDDDPLVWEAAQIVVDTQLGSTSGLQRKLKVGYARAGRIMDMLEAKGVVGPQDGSKPREVLLDQDQLEELRVQDAKYRGV
ncbi:MAG: DNA translocase FtsK 4TM domain-containing protein [Atopobiaceae bacterium]|jgi:S-DNA-T family DNA segregation ATPase FtsK/SpoIIIE